MLRSNWIFWAVIALLTQSCIGDIVGTDVGGELDKNRRKWRDAGITSYTFREDRSCFCGLFGPANITVVDGQIVAVRLFFPDTVDVEPGQFNQFETVEGLFDTVSDALEQKAHQLEVTYDELLGFPSQIAIDYIEHAIDDEITLTASAMSPTGNSSIP